MKDLDKFDMIFQAYEYEKRELGYTLTYVHMDTCTCE